MQRSELQAVGQTIVLRESQQAGRGDGSGGRTADDQYQYQYTGRASTSSAVAHYSGGQGQSLSLSEHGETTDSLDMFFSAQQQSGSGSFEAVGTTSRAGDAGSTTMSAASASDYPSVDGFFYCTFFDDEKTLRKNHVEKRTS